MNFGKAGRLSSNNSAQQISTLAERIDLDLDLTVRTVAAVVRPDEPDMAVARELIRSADHLTLVYPNRWGTMPALMKGFLDRLMTPGFAFADKPDGGWDKLLHGKTAQLITTMDMPRWVYRLIYCQPGNNAMKRSTLGFSGIRTTRILNLGPVKDSGEQQPPPGSSARDQKACV